MTVKPTTQDEMYDVKSLTRIFKRLPAELQQSTWLTLSEVMEGYAKSTKEQFDLNLMSDFTEEGIERNKNWGKMQGLSSGYKKIDQLTKGFVGGEITIVAGKTSYGKTMLAINMANKIALSGVPVLFVTLEMTRGEITSRFIHINGGDNEDYQTVSSLVAFQATNELDWQSIDGLVEKFVKQFTNGLIVIDHLHYFTRELQNIAEDLGRITKELKKNAIVHNVPIVLISHVRKTLGNASAGIDDLRGSSYIAQDADIVLMVGRDPKDASKLAVKIEKNRNRGYSYLEDTADMFLDGIKIYDNKLEDWSYPNND